MLTLNFKINYSTEVYILKILLFRTTDEEFNPKPATPKLIFHSLADLLSQVHI